MPATVIIYGGPNGSGKSFSKQKMDMSPTFPGMYINADEITNTLEGQIKDPYKRNMRAAVMAEERRKEALSNGESFAFETVMSTPGKLAIMQDAKNKGYHVHLFFITTEDPEINVQRVEKRVAQGGHAVDPQKIVERYDRAMNLLPSAVEMADRVDIYDNSVPGRDPLRVARKAQGELVVETGSEVPAWVLDRLVTPLMSRQSSRRLLQGRVPEGHRVEPADITDGQEYKGVLVGQTRHHLLQKTEQGQYVVHDLALRPAVKRKSNQVSYHYKGGKIVDRPPRK